MKPCLIALAVTSLISCNGSSQQTTQQKEIEPNWRVAQITTQEHSYNKSGLLDTTRRTEDIYVNGVSGVVMNFIITRDYDERNNKIVERTFQVMKKKNELFEEVLYKYDAKNNLVVTTDKVEDVISEINQYKCNSENQKIEEIRIRKKFEEHPWDGNLDSAVAHRNDKETPHYDTLITSYKYNKNKNLINQKIEEIRIDKKFEEHSWHGNLDSAFVHRNDKEIPRYDTSIISYKYDKKGNPINQLYINSRGEIGETVTTLYSGKQKTLTFGITSKGDTVSKVTYAKNGNLLTVIANSSLSTDTNIYDSDKLIQEVFTAKTMNLNRKETFKYDEKGNVIEDVKYK